MPGITSFKDGASWVSFLPLTRATRADTRLQGRPRVRQEYSRERTCPVDGRRRQDGAQGRHHLHRRALLQRQDQVPLVRRDPVRQVDPGRSIRRRVPRGSQGSGQEVDAGHSGWSHGRHSQRRRLEHAQRRHNGTEDTLGRREEFTVEKLSRYRSNVSILCVRRTLTPLVAWSISSPTRRLPPNSHP